MQAGPDHSAPCGIFGRNAKIGAVVEGGDATFSTVFACPLVLKQYENAAYFREFREVRGFLFEPSQGVAIATLICRGGRRHA